MLQLFESHAGALEPNMFSEFALPYIRQISSRVKEGLVHRGLEVVPMVRMSLVFFSVRVLSIILVRRNARNARNARPFTPLTPEKYARTYATSAAKTQG